MIQKNLVFVIYTQLMKIRGKEESGRKGIREIYKIFLEQGSLKGEFRNPLL